MPFEIVRNDITNMQVDAIVSAADEQPRVLSGVDMAIHKKAGPQLLRRRQRIGYIAPGDAAITPAFGLDAQYVIHAVGPVWQDDDAQAEELLAQTYERCLALAQQHGCHSVAFPLLSSGNKGFSSAKALQIAVSTFSSFLLRQEMQIYLVVFNKESFVLSEQLMQNVKAFIDEHYVDVYMERYGGNRERMQQVRVQMPSMAMPSAVMSLDDFLKHKEETFAVKLVDLIQKSGKKNSQVYKKANVDKKLFSKIVNNVNYHPSKETALSFAIALELDLAQTRDLIGRAGYALSRSSKFDLIVEYFIREGNYDIFRINEVLFAFDQVLLGC